MVVWPLVPLCTRQAGIPSSASVLSDIRTHLGGLSRGPVKTGLGLLSRSASSKTALERVIPVLVFRTPFVECGDGGPLPVRSVLKRFGRSRLIEVRCGYNMRRSIALVGLVAAHSL